MPVGLLSCLPPARWYHELELTDGAGNVSIIVTGFFDLRPSITAQAVLTIGLKPK
jgi:hypothetical protein